MEAAKEIKVDNPLVIRCTQCGGETSFDIIKQRYVCSHCGTESEPESHTAEYHNWKKLQQEKRHERQGEAKLFSCPACGAQTLASADDVSAECPFCHNTMIDSKVDEDSIPEIIIPFKITREEAKKRLGDWISSNSSNPASAAIQKRLQQLTGCYLPYHIVRGTFKGIMDIANQAGESQKYPFNAHLDHTAVNASKDWDNIFLDGIEPFDFNEAREFDYRYLVNQKAKTQNIPSEELATRIFDETTLELYETLTEITHTKEFDVKLQNQNNDTFLAALPAYVIQCDNGIAAAVNGQTGKVAIMTGRTINMTANWWIRPTAFTIGIWLFCFLLGNLTLSLIVGAVIGILFFVIAYRRHSKILADEILTFPKSKKNHNGTKALFYADFGNGVVPARIDFVPKGRSAKTTIISLSAVLLPVLIAIPIQLSRGLSILDIHYQYGLVWFIGVGFFPLMMAAGLAKGLYYNDPIYYEILPDGRSVRRKVKSKKRSVIKNLLSDLDPKAGCLVVGFMIFILALTVYAMLEAF